MRKRYTRILLVVVTLVVVAMVGVRFGSTFYRAQCRKAWKDRVIPEIARKADDAAWVTREQALLTKDEDWLSDSMILMASGEWLVYANHCSKSDWRIEDICLARGSDGKWYYTTCHFCIDMMALVMMQDSTPKDLAYFVKRYQMREFDGKSNECLQKTQSFPDEL